MYLSVFIFLIVRLAEDLKREAQQHKLSHPNIVKLIAMVFEAGHYGTVFEFVKYGDLDSFLRNYMVSLMITPKTCSSGNV